MDGYDAVFRNPECFMQYEYLFVSQYFLQVGLVADQRIVGLGR